MGGGAEEVSVTRPLYGPRHIEGVDTGESIAIDGSSPQEIFTFAAVCREGFTVRSGVDIERLLHDAPSRFS